MFENITNHTPTILVVGDLMSDHYLFGDCNRISPEAPVQVIDIKEEKTLLGGAGNVMNNLIALGSKVECISVLGDDENAEFIIRRLNTKNIKAHIITEANRYTSKKTRIISTHQQIVRFDKESKHQISDDSSKQIINKLQQIIKNIDIVILSDYNKGVLHETLTKDIIKIVKDNEKIVCIDPKKNDYTLYQNADIVTPNKSEAAACVGYSLDTKDDIIKAGKYIQQTYNIKNVIITLSEDGMAIFGDEVEFISTIAKEVYDVTGAGDTVISALSYYYSLCGDIVSSCKFANMAAAVVVEKIGSATATIDEIKNYYQIHDTSTKIKYFDNLSSVLKHKDDKKIVFTNGCFDILHVGHIKYLQIAKSYGDLLILGLNSDRSVRELKGESRPINTQEDRAYILSALAVVDLVVVFDSEDELHNLIKQIKPDILVKGKDYEGKAIRGSEFAKEVRLVEFVDGKSTTKTINKIQKSDK